MYLRASAVFALVMLFLGVNSQQVGSFSSEFHPPITTQTCSSAGCTSVDSSIVIDANWRWIHNNAGTNCYTGNQWNPALCPDPTTCASTCALEGVTQSGYQSTYGITTSGSEVNIGFVTGANVGSRIYLMEDTNTYQMFKLKNREFAVDVDTSKLPCGLNGALYFVEMSADGGLSEYSGNKAGAKYGTGYCDAQCPQDIKFINGQANSAGWTPSPVNPNAGTGSYGSCCFEMDIWEANAFSTALTPHPCSVQGQTRCTGADCGAGVGNRYNSLCDADGCDYNPYRMGNHTFYGPGQTIDGDKPMTVVTQFITDDGTDSGNLVEIKRFYKQGNNVFSNSYGTFAGVNEYNSITDDFCTAQKTLFGDPNVFPTKGGLQAMGESMDRGQVLVMSLWDDYAAECLWLDSNYPLDAAASKPGVARGSCPTTSGVPSQVESQYGSASVSYGNIKVGTLGSTTPGVPAPSNGVATSAPTQAATHAPTQAPATQAPTHAPTQAPVTQAPTHAPTQAPVTQAPTHAPTQAPVTQAPTHAPTQAPATQAPTHAPTQAPVTQAPTHAPTEAPSCGNSPSQGACDASNIHITQTAANSWPQGDATVVQWNVFVSTSCTTNALVALTLNTEGWNPVSGGFWGFTEQAGDQLVLPSYISVTPNAPLTWLGYENIGGMANFTVASYTFQ